MPQYFISLLLRIFFHPSRRGLSQYCFLEITLSLHLADVDASVYNTLEDSVSLLVLIVVHRRSVLCWCWRDVFSRVLVSGYPPFPLAAAPRLSLLHLVYLCSHSGENTVPNLEDESDSHMLSISKPFFSTFLPFCCSSYMMKRLFGKSDLETRCGYWSKFRVIHDNVDCVLQVGSAHLDSDVFRLHFDYEVSQNTNLKKKFFMLSLIRWASLKNASEHNTFSFLYIPTFCSTKNHNLLLIM